MDGIFFFFFLAMQIVECCSLQCPAEFISHSFSISELQFLFLHVLPDLTGKLVVDVGSRLGAVLYGVRYFGIELSCVSQYLIKSVHRASRQWLLSG